jgi:ubiquinone biosynthesis accessory factor UbiJ
MLNAILTPIGAAAMARITLLLNHVLSSEAVATERLKPHAGRTVHLVCTGLPFVLPTLPVMAFTVTAAGLLEWCGESLPVAPELKVSLDVSNPAQLAGQWLSGERPAMGIEGDSAFAADVSWLIENLRWDIEDDVAKIVGPTVAHQLAQMARWVTRGFGFAVSSLQGFAARRGGGAAS